MRLPSRMRFSERTGLGPDAVPRRTLPRRKILRRSVRRHNRRSRRLVSMPWRDALAHLSDPHWRTLLDQAGSPDASDEANGGGVAAARNYNRNPLRPDLRCNAGTVRFIPRALIAEPMLLTPFAP